MVYALTCLIFQLLFIWTFSWNATLYIAIDFYLKIETINVKSSIENLVFYYKNIA